MTPRDGSNDSEVGVHRRQAAVDGSIRRIVDMLLQAGAEADAPDHDGNTPLLTSAGTGCVALCKRLLTHGANADTRCHALFLCYFNGCSSVFVACAAMLCSMADVPSCCQEVVM